MRNITLSAVLLATSFAGAQTVTVGSTTSSVNGSTTTITVPVSVAVPPAPTVATAANMASLRVEAGNGDGTSTGQNVGTNFTTIILPRVVADSASGWNATANTWTVPTTGTYLVITNIRFVDNLVSGLSYGQGANTSNVDNASFLWNTTNGKRNGSTNTRIMQLTAGQAVDLFAYVDSSQPIAVSGASLTIQQLQ